MASASHQNHLQLQGLVSSVSAAYAQSAAINSGHSSGFHPVMQHIHHPQPMPFGPILHPAHHVQNPHAHHSHLLQLPPTNAEFYKNHHLPNNVIVPSVLSHPMPLLATSISSHMTASLPPQTAMPMQLSAAAAHIPSSHSTISHQSHHSPKSSASSVIEPSQDSIGSPLIVDNIDSVSSPISVSSNSNNNNNNNTKNDMNSNKNHNKHENGSSATANSHTTESSSIKSNGDAPSSSFHRNAVRTAQNNGLMDILMNPDKCQVS